MLKIDSFSLRSDTLFTCEMFNLHQNCALRQTNVQEWLFTHRGKVRGGWRGGGGTGCVKPMVVPGEPRVNGQAALQSVLVCT